MEVFCFHDSTSFVSFMHCVCVILDSLFSISEIMSAISFSLTVLSMELVLCKGAVSQELRVSTEQQQLKVLLLLILLLFGSVDSHICMYGN